MRRRETQQHHTGARALWRTLASTIRRVQLHSQTTVTHLPEEACLERRVSLGRQATTTIIFSFKGSGVIGRSLLHHTTTTPWRGTNPQMACKRHLEEASPGLSLALSAELPAGFSSSALSHFADSKLEMDRNTTRTCKLKARSRQSWACTTTPSQQAPSK